MDPVLIVKAKRRTHARLRIVRVQLHQPVGPSESAADVARSLQARGYEVLEVRAVNHAWHLEPNVVVRRPAWALWNRGTLHQAFDDLDEGVEALLETWRARPTVHVTNWSSTKLHGPGRKLTIMAAPRQWEHGDGFVAALRPRRSDLADARTGRMDLDEYRRRFRWGLAQRAEAGALAPGHLEWGSSGAVRHVSDGDTLCCACSRAEAAKGRCHRVWAAEALHEAGWRVVLDGRDLDLSEADNDV